MRTLTPSPAVYPSGRTPVETSFPISCPNQSRQRVHYSTLAGGVAGGVIDPPLPQRRDIWLGGKRRSEILGVAEVNPSVCKTGRTCRV